MSLVIGGNAAHVTSLSATVVGIADNGSGRERVQTSAPHLFGDQDFVNLQVTISGTLVYQYGTITVIDTTHFDLTAINYTATGTGTAYDLSLTPPFRAPTDGDTASLQLSGLTSSQEMLADRTQALRLLLTQRTTILATFTGPGRAHIPSWCTAILCLGAGGGGGGGAGFSPPNGDATIHNPAGGGGAGAPQGFAFVSLLPVGATSIDVVVGAGGTGGTAGSSPTKGGDGGTSTLAWHDGASAGSIFARFFGGAGGGGGDGGPGHLYCGPTQTPVYTPGGRGGAGLLRSSPFGRRSPGPRQLADVVNSDPGGTGVLIVSTLGNEGPNDFPNYDDPVGQMDLGEGGASVANGYNPSYPAALSYAGAYSSSGQLGGAAGALGVKNTNAGGAGGGGGGGGAYGGGGAGGTGGDGSAAGAGTDGVFGGTGGTTGGGGGGGGGGVGHTTSGTGGDGGNGGNGVVQILFLGIPSNG